MVVVDIVSALLLFIFFPAGSNFFHSSVTLFRSSRLSDRFGELCIEHIFQLNDDDHDYSES